MNPLRRRLAGSLFALALSPFARASGDLPPARVPRFGPPRRQVASALVLGSGGPRGFAHIGVLKVLEEAGFRPDLVVGSSVGAMVGALYASGLDARRLERLSADLSFTTFLDLPQFFGRRGSGRAIEDFVDEAVGGRAMEELQIGLAVVATRIRDRSLALFDRGDTGLAVRASSAQVDRYEPVEIAGELYADGDEVSPVPIRAARRMGARFVVAVDVSAYASRTPPGVPQAWIDRDARRARQVAAEAPEADLLLHPDIGYFAGFDDEYRRRVIGLAERYARGRAEEIRAALVKGKGP